MPIGGLDVDRCPVLAVVVLVVELDVWAFAVDVWALGCKVCRFSDPEAVILYVVCHCGKMMLMMNSEKSSPMFGAGLEVVERERY